MKIGVSAKRTLRERYKQNFEDIDQLDVDYMMLSHYHTDHGGSNAANAGSIKFGNEELVLSGFSQAAQFLNLYYFLN